MTSVRYRENTFKVDLSNFPKRPTFEEIHGFIHETIGLKLEQVIRLQMNHAQNCAHVRCANLDIALDAVDQHNGKHELEINGKKYIVRLIMDDGGVEVKIHDLSENVTNQEICDYLRQYGEVLQIQELMWSDKFAFKGVPTGIRVAKMKLRKHIKSFVTIQGEQTLVSYRNQPQTCRHCMHLAHPGNSCVQNKKLLGQKTDLEKRLKELQKEKPIERTYASVLDGAASALMPNFTSTTLDNSKPKSAIQQHTNHTSDNLTPHPSTDSPSDTAMTQTERMEESSIQSPIKTVAQPAHSKTANLEEREKTVSRPMQHANDMMSPIVLTDKLPTSTKQVNIFKVPSRPLPDISENESCESSTECVTGFSNVKRGRGRQKKVET